MMTSLLIRKIHAYLNAFINCKRVQAVHWFLLSLFFLPIFAYAEMAVESEVEGDAGITTIWVVGDKDLVADAFSVAATLFGNGGVTGALLLSSMLAIGTMAFATVIHRNMQVFNYIVIFVVVTVLFSIKTTVYVASYYDLDPKTGKVTGGVIGAVPSKKIDNVPIGIAWPLGLMSNTAKILTEQYDTAMQKPEKNAGYLIQGSEGYFSPLKTVLQLRNQWNLPENQYIMKNIRAATKTENGKSVCGWNDGAELLGKRGIRGLLADSHPSGYVDILIPKNDPKTGETLSIGTYNLPCPLAGLVINAQMLQNVTKLTDKEYSKIGESMAKTRNLSLTSAGTKDHKKHDERATATQIELDQLPNLIIKNLTGKQDPSSVATTIQDIEKFLNQVIETTEKQNGNVHYQDIEKTGTIPSTMLLGNAIALEHINSAEIQANMIFGNLLLNCLQSDKNCARSEMLMLDARSKAAIDAAGEASMFAHYMHYGMNILMFIYVVMSPIMIIVIMAMGFQGWRLIKSYLLFAVWINSWLPISIAVSYYQLSSFENSIANLVSSLRTDPAMVYSPVVLNNILNGVQDCIASASTFTASVPLIMLSLLGGSIYGLTQLAQRAGMGGRDYINEGAVTQSADDAQSYNAQIARALMSSTNGNATSANASHLMVGSRQTELTSMKISSAVSQTENAKQTISDNISALEKISDTATWSHIDSFDEGVEKGLTIGKTNTNEMAISFGQHGSHNFAQADSTQAGFTLGAGGKKGNIVAFSSNGSIDENVQIMHENGETETLKQGMQIADTDTIKTKFGSVSAKQLAHSQTQEIDHQKAQLSAIETAQSHSNNGEISFTLDQKFANAMDSAPNYKTAHQHALQAAGEYGETQFAQKVATGNLSQNVAAMKQALDSHDEKEVQAAGAYLKTMISETNIDEQGVISKQLDGYLAIHNNDFEQKVRDEITSDISAAKVSDEQILANFSDDSISQQGQKLHDDIESGKTQVGSHAGKLSYAKEHNGYSHDQVAQIHKLNQEEIIKQAEQTMERLRTIHNDKMAKRDYGVSDEYLECAEYLWNMENATLLDKSMAVLGFAAGYFEKGVGYIPIVNTFVKHVVASNDNEWKELIAEGVDNGHVAAEQLKQLVGNAKQNLEALDVPLTDEIAKQVGEPVYADELAKLDKAQQDNQHYQQPSQSESVSHANHQADNATSHHTPDNTHFSNHEQMLKTSNSGSNTQHTSVYHSERNQDTQTKTEVSSSVDNNRTEDAHSGSLKDTQTVQSQTESVGDKYPKFDKLLGLHEGGYDDFNTPKGSKYAAHRGEEIADGKKLSDFTVGEIMQMQKNGELNAAGHYQITKDAMIDAVRLSGVSTDEKFSPEIQDKLFEDGLLKKAGAGKLYDYITGKSDDIDKAMLATAQEWAAFPVPHNMHITDEKFGDRDLKAGDSYYEGVKGNHSNMSLEDAKAAIEEMRANYLAAHSVDNQAEQQKEQDEQLLKEQARAEEDERQKQADEEERRLAQQKAAEEQARLEREKAEKAEAERKKKEEEDNKKAKNSTITTDKDGKHHITMKSFKKPFDKLPDNAPSWLKVANREMGTREIPGPKHEPRVIEYHSTTTAKLKTDDKKGPWCSSFVSWVMTQDGVNGTHSARARDWYEKWNDGEKLDKPAYGAIAVIKHADGTGHVGFVAGVDEKTGDLLLLGGNQSNMVNLTPQRAMMGAGDKILGYVYPKGHTPDYNIPTISSSAITKGKAVSTVPKQVSTR